MLPGLLFCKEKKNARIGEYGAARARQSPEGFALKGQKEGFDRSPHNKTEAVSV